jgi:N-carbamoyl-L-amino-acid hydrolase
VAPGLLKHSIEWRAHGIARQTGTEIQIKIVEHDPPAIADPEIQAKIEEAAASLGLKTMRLPSGAGHDAQWLARLAPMGMIFVPGVGGICHSPKEVTTWQDCAKGANVLLQTILCLDSR